MDTVATQTPQKRPTPAGPDLSQRIRDAQGVEMALVPAGEFQMGHKCMYKDERPVHTVYLDAFYMDIYEVTNALYAQCQQAGTCSAPAEASFFNRSSYYGDPEFASYPVVQVDWQQAQAFCEWRRARLPTEAEWEKAARGGLDGRLYPWGDEEPVCQAGAENGAQYGYCESGVTLQVGYFAPNGYGLFDMAGNVAEWVADWYDAGYYNVSPTDNPSGPASGSSKVLRFGALHLVELKPLHLASRSREAPGNRGNSIGFRCVVSP